MKIVLISGHDAQSARKTGFHFWKDILSARGDDVRFITVGVSRVSQIKKDGKDLVPPFNEWVDLKPHLKKFTWVPPFHPFYVGTSFLNFLLWPVFKFYPALLPKSLIDEIRDADYFVVENGAGPLLVPSLYKHAPKARFVYNASDRLRILKFHPSVIEGSQKALRYFSLIRLNAAPLADDFPMDSPMLYVPQAIDKSGFDVPHKNPYSKPRNAISVGDMLFDANVIETLARKFPDWDFHLFAKEARLKNSYSNVHEYGEVSFDTLIPYLQHADIGLAPYRNDPDAGYLSQSSLKMVQYSYCRLPIVAPHFAGGEREHIITYDPDRPLTIPEAFQSAISYPRTSIDPSTLPTWENVIDAILANTKERPI